jgi:hypothetical protein
MHKTGQKMARCGALGCDRLFNVVGDGTPAIYICPTCEVRMNEGIKVFIHERTGRPNGNVNTLDKRIILL